MGKDWAGPFFPPSLIFRSSIDHFVFRFMLLFHSILTFMKDLYQSENQVFNPIILLVLLHCGVGKDWAGPFFPPSKILGSFYLSSRLLDYVILLLYLNSLNLYQAENQVFKPTSLFVIVGWGKNGSAGERLGRPVLSPLLNLWIVLLIIPSFGLCYSFTVS